MLKKSLLLVSLFIFQTLLFSESKKPLYRIDFSKPSSVVTAANKMLIKSDYKAMLQITALNEKKRTEAILSNLKADSKLYLKVRAEMSRIQNFKILGEEIYNHSTGKIALVRTEWSIKVKATEIATKPKALMPRDKKRKATTHVYTDYLLKSFNGKWKIISQKSR